MLVLSGNTCLTPDDLGNTRNESSGAANFMSRLGSFLDVMLYKLPGECHQPELSSACGIVLLRGETVQIVYLSPP